MGVALPADAGFSKPAFLDFFAGSGLVSEALKRHFVPVWANDICAKKAAVYCANHPGNVFVLGPIEEIRGEELPFATLSWASFPCQDLSLAGNLKGISSPRSGLVWQWIRIMDEMKVRPPIVVAENVVGLISAKNGEYYESLHRALRRRGYKVGAVVIDAAYWIPQSRKRVFVVAVNENIDAFELAAGEPRWCHPSSLQKTALRFRDFVWWDLPKPKTKRKHLDELIDPKAPSDDAAKTRKNLSLIPQKHLDRMNSEAEKGITVFPGYKRIRRGQQVLELRFDGLAGCLRTPQGGSSRQLIVIRDNGSYATRLLTVEETAALMGVRKSYRIPGSYNDGYKAMGDAVAVPAARHIARYLLSPLAESCAREGIAQ